MVSKGSKNAADLLRHRLQAWITRFCASGLISIEHVRVIRESPSNSQIIDVKTVQLRAHPGKLLTP